MPGPNSVGSVFQPGPRLIDGTDLQKLLLGQTSYTALSMANGSASSPSFFYESVGYNAIPTVAASQTSATTITNEITTVVTSVGTTAPYDGLVLPPSNTSVITASGHTVFIINKSANPIQIFANGTDTIDNLAGSVGVVMMPNSLVLFTCATPGQWFTEGLATGYGGPGLQTLSWADGLVANSGAVQTGATPITTMVARFTTVGGAGYSSLLPVAAPGLSITVINAGANTMAVFPASGDAINNLAANLSFLMQPQSVCTFFTTKTGFWHTEYTLNIPQPLLQTTASNTTAFTATAAQVTGAAEVDFILTGALGSGQALTLPLATAVIAAIPNAQVGQTYKLRFINGSSGAFAWTITTNTGWTLNSTLASANTVAQNTWRDYLVTISSGTTLTAQSVGTGTYS